MLVNTALNPNMLTGSGGGSPSVLLAGSSMSSQAILPVPVMTAAGAVEEGVVAVKGAAVEGMGVEGVAVVTVERVGVEGGAVA